MAASPALAREELIEPEVRHETHFRAQPFLREVRKRGDTLFWEGGQSTHLIHVMEGFVKLVKHGASGKDIIVGIYGPGDILGEMNLLDRQPYNATAVVMTPAVISRESLDRLHSQLHKNPVLLRSIAQTLSTRLRETQDTVQQIATERVERRIAAMLLKLAKCRRNEEGCSLRVPLKRQEMAELVGTTVETTIRVLSRFTQDGALRRIGRQLFIMDMDYLRAIAQSAG